MLGTQTLYISIESKSSKLYTVQASRSSQVKRVMGNENNDEIKFLLVKVIIVIETATMAGGSFSKKIAPSQFSSPVSLTDLLVS